MLIKHQFLSIKERVVRIHEEFKILIGTTTLKVMYKRNDIKVRQPKKVLRRTEDSWEKLIVKRVDFSKELQPLLGDRNLIYMDESTFYTWNRVSKLQLNNLFSIVLVIIRFLLFV